MTDRPRYRLLGPLEVRRDGADRPVTGPQQRALLAVLLAHRGRAVTDDVLVDTLWPDGPPPSARHTLRAHVSRLRTLVGDDVRTLDGGYVLDVPPDATDAGAFEAMVRAAGAQAPRDTVVTLEQALALWHGPAFGRAAELAPVAAAARHLDGLRLDALHALAAATSACAAMASASSANAARPHTALTTWCPA
ncbi:transcriptional regulator, partial [Cellulomonas fimi]|uniref:AfsR/SARP family transcriptional regulator n=1 Tax=Cellulomonas fimi TaxID=1708 RepID=UPI0014789A2B